MAVRSETFDPTQLGMCVRWKNRVAPLIAATGGARATLRQAGEAVLGLGETEERTRQGIAWLVATTAHLVDEHSFLEDLSELFRVNSIVRAVVGLSANPAAEGFKEEFEEPITVILPPIKTHWDLRMELPRDAHVIVMSGWNTVELVGPDTGEAFVQVPNDHDVLRVIRGNISSTRDGATWTGTNPLKEPT